MPAEPHHRPGSQGSLHKELQVRYYVLLMNQRQDLARGIPAAFVEARGGGRTVASALKPVRLRIMEGVLGAMQKNEASC